MRAVVILGLALGGSSALAQELSGYTGVAVGAFAYANETGGAFSDTVPTWKIYGGFQAGRYFSIEVGREWPGSIEVDEPGSPLTIATRRFNVAHSLDLELTTMKVMARLPLRRFDLWAGFGMYTMDADADFEFTLNSSTRRTSLAVEETGDVVALGVDWKLGQVDHPFDVRLEYEYFHFSFSDASAVVVGVAYRFGG